MAKGSRKSSCTSNTSVYHKSAIFLQSFEPGSTTLETSFVQRYRKGQSAGVRMLGKMKTLISVGIVPDNKCIMNAHATPSLWIEDMRTISQDWVCSSEEGI
eukprot:Lithocolla_globosa_v1_NODE_3470_length_1661_cov_21.199875.p5 type:complete len:101 gc:universal NODE_3470_length_1661_cov_21.199875:1382-1080(-)